MKQQTYLALLCTLLAVALSGCPSQTGDGNPPANTTPPGKSNTSNTTSSSNTAGSSSSNPTLDTAKDKLAQASQDVKQGTEKLGEEAKQGMQQAGQEAQKLGSEVQQGAQDATAKAKAGIANFSAEAKQKYPKVVESMQQQFDAMNKAAVEKYRDTFTPDAPERDKLVNSFKDETQYKPQYTIDSFVVDKASDTEAVATVAVTYTGTDVAKPQATQHKKYKYTFHKQATEKDWKVFKIEPIA